MIELQDVRKRFVVGGETLDVLRGIDLRIDRGEFVVVMGRSGSGKSTLLNIIGCLDTPCAGHYRLGGRDVSTLQDEELADIRNRHIGFIFQGFNLIARNTARANVEKPLVYQGVPASRRREKTTEMLDKVGLSDRAAHLPSQLSGGQQQRVAIARALIVDPDLLIADEPTGNLDSSTGQDIMALLRRISHEGKTIVLVTHDAALSRYADRVVHIADGRVDLSS